MSVIGIVKCLQLCCYKLQDIPLATETHALKKGKYVGLEKIALQGRIATGGVQTFPKTE